MPDEITRARERQRELEHERQLAAIHTQSHAIVWTGTAKELAATITKWYESGRIVAESLEDALHKASIHFMTPDGKPVIKPDAAGIPRRTRAAPLPPKDAEFPKRAAWLTARLKERAWGQSDINRQSGPDRKTIRKILNGAAVREDVLDRLARALSAKHHAVDTTDIPTD